MVRCERLPGCISSSSKQVRPYMRGVAAHKRVKPRCTLMLHTRVVLTTSQEDTCGKEAAARPNIKVTYRQKQEQVEIVGRQEEVAGSRHTLRQIIMPGRFSTVMKPKVNCYTSATEFLCFTNLFTS